MPDNFRRATDPSFTATQRADRAIMDRKRQQLEALYAKRALTDGDVRAFTSITGLAAPNDVRSGAELSRALASGGLVQTRVRIF